MTDSIFRKVEKDVTEELIQVYILPRSAAKKMATVMVAVATLGGVDVEDELDGKRKKMTKRNLRLISHYLDRAAKMADELIVMAEEGNHVHDS